MFKIVSIDFGNYHLRLKDRLKCGDLEVYWIGCMANLKRQDGPRPDIGSTHRILCIQSRLGDLHGHNEEAEQSDKLAVVAPLGGGCPQKALHS